MTDSLNLLKCEIHFLKIIKKFQLTTIDYVQFPIEIIILPVFILVY